MTAPTFNPKSILDSTKKALGMGFDYDVFDADIIMHINSVFATLHQLGIGPDEGFMLESDQEEWDAFLGAPIDPALNSVRTYVYLKVRLVFDPPTNSFTQDSIKEIIKEHEWRLNVYRESRIRSTSGVTNGLQA